LYKKYQLKLVLISFFIQLLWNYFGINLLNNFGKILGQDNFSFPFLFSHIFWFVSGFYFLENKDKITSKINIEIGIILILILNIVRTMPLYYGLQLFKYKDIPADYFYIITAINPFFYAIEILVVYKIALLILNEKAKISNLLKKIGDYSLEIYLIHALVITILNNILRGINISPEILLFYPILWIGSVFISAAFALIYRKMETRLKKVVLLNNN
jgi:peptidoglycan/LPS O-acetylase OafA/YrhL